VHPLIAGRLLFPLHEALKRKPTFPWLRRLEATQWWPAERLEAYRLERLRALLAFAGERAPYYRALFRRHDLDPARATFEDLARIPPLTRQTVRERFADLQARPPAGPVQALATGGSTGVPVRVLVDMARLGFGEAARLRAHRWFGLEPGAREVVLWGSPIEVTRQDRVRALRDRLLNSRLLSAFDLGEAALARYAGVLDRLRPAKIYGYASAIYLLARYLEGRGRRPASPPRAVFTTAEPLFDFQRAAIERVFGCPVAQEYGARDAGLIAHECPAGGLHIPAEGVHVEVLGDRGDGVGEILVTLFDSPSFPIVRYRTGDLGRLDLEPCRCGRTLPRLRAVEGRHTDFLVTPDGRCLHALAAIYVLRETPRVAEFAVRQDALDHVVVSVVPEPGFAEADAAAIRARLGAVLGPRVDVEVLRVPEIARAPSGKFRYVVSAVAEEVLNRMLDPEVAGR
jgi:phenylacetate-CoA ligase